MYYIVLSSTVKFISISIKKNKSKIRLFQLVVNPAFNYLIHFTVRKTCFDFEGLWISRKATFHCIAIWVFNWDSKWLTTTSWKSNNGWTSCYRRWVNFSVIRSWNEVYCSFYFPICGTSVVTQRNPTAIWITCRKRENRKVVLSFHLVFYFCSPNLALKPWSCPIAYLSMRLIQRDFLGY